MEKEFDVIDIPTPSLTLEPLDKQEPQLPPKESQPKVPEPALTPEEQQIVNNLAAQTDVALPPRRKWQTSPMPPWPMCGPRTWAKWAT